jgi:hypothetical protein
MTTDQPRVNQSGFVAVHQHSILAIVPDGRLDETTAALAEVGVDLTRVDVLQGEIGADILDFAGTKHGALGACCSNDAETRHCVQRARELRSRSAQRRRGHRDSRAH